MDLTRARRLIVFGGSFDPPQAAHVALPAMAMETVSADAVLYVPAGRAPHKEGCHRTPAHHRLAMLRLAVAHRPRCVVLTDEIKRAADGRPSYTVETLAALRSRLGESVELRLLIGADMLRIWPQWREPRRIVELAAPLVMARPPETREGLLSSLPEGESRAAWEPRLLDLPRMEVSSTEVRRRVREGRSVGGLVPAAVEDYVRRWGLYRGRNDE